MGIDKSLGTWNPIAIINGEVWQYGVVDEDIYTGEPYESPDYMIENFSYAKAYWCFKSEEEYRNFLDALPESAERIPSNHPRGWDRRSPEEIAEIADRRRRERQDEENRLWIFEGQGWDDLSKEDKRKAAFVDEVRCAIMAVCLDHLKPMESLGPDISNEIELIVADALRRYRAQLSKPEKLPKDYRNEDVRQRHVKEYLERRK